MATIHRGLWTIAVGAAQRHRRGGVRLCDSSDVAGPVLTGGNDLAALGGDATERDATENALPRCNRVARTARARRISWYTADPTALRDTAASRHWPCDDTSDNPHRRRTGGGQQLSWLRLPSNHVLRSRSGRSPPMVSSRRFAARRHRSPESCGIRTQHALRNCRGGLVSPRFQRSRNARPDPGRRAW